MAEKKIDFTAGDQADKYRYYPDDPTSLENQLKFAIKEPSKFYDPCHECSKMSIRCLEQNGYENKSVCDEYFKAYRECKKEWLAKRKEDRRNGGGW